MLETASACPSPSLASARPAPPSPEGLAYSLTLPATLVSPAVARAATRTILRTHGVDDLTDTAVQVVSELIACACQFTPATDVYLSLRYREGVLRVILFDGHPRHSHPRLAATCDARRRAALRVLGCVVRACGGDWGFGDAREPGGGTRMWAKDAEVKRAKQAKVLCEAEHGPAHDEFTRDFREEL